MVVIQGRPRKTIRRRTKITYVPDSMTSRTKSAAPGVVTRSHTTPSHQQAAEIDSATETSGRRSRRSSSSSSTVVIVEEAKTEDEGPVGETDGGASRDINAPVGAPDAAAAVAPAAPQQTQNSQMAAAAADTVTLASVMQQLASTMTRLTERMDELEAAQATRVASPAVPVCNTGSLTQQATMTMTEIPVATSTATMTVPPQPAVSTRMKRASRRQARRRGGPGDSDPDDDSSISDGDSSESSDPDWSSSSLGDSSSPSSSSDSDSSDSSKWGDSDDSKKQRRRSIKDLELPNYSPSPSSSVSVWIDRVDLALKGAKRSGRGRWSDRDLYYILGNKLVDNAARFYTALNRRLTRRKRTWTTLKKALLRRYGERVDRAAAEFRVAQRVFAPGETYADFAAGLREAAGRTRVRERMLLAQFYRCLDMTVEALVRQRPKPKTLEEAVDKAMKIDRSDANVRRGMMNIGQFWPQAPAPGVAQVAGNTGTAAVLPGVGRAQLGRETADAEVSADVDPDGFVAFTNPRGTYNNWTGIWEAPPGRTWNGRQWVAKGKAKRGLAQQQELEKRGSKKQEKKAKTLLVRTVDSSEGDEDESDVPPEPHQKKRKAPVRQVQVTTGTKTSANPPLAPPQLSGLPRCYACGNLGHFARECTDPAAKARNDAYLAQHEAKSSKPENDGAAQ